MDGLQVWMSVWALLMVVAALSTAVAGEWGTAFGAGATAVAFGVWLRTTFRK
jgi:hypothetical protein